MALNLRSSLLNLGSGQLEFFCGSEDFLPGRWIDRKAFLAPNGHRLALGFPCNSDLVKAWSNRYRAQSVHEGLTLLKEMVVLVQTLGVDKYAKHTVINFLFALVSLVPGSATR